ncbi:MAG: hypothetical protein LBK06_00415 [Planctomycetaceae bacterium]|nr:hypothetical protein [Planctomycetaceae bacterium]
MKYTEVAISTTTSNTSRPCGAWGVGGTFPAVALRYTAGYAHLTPAGLFKFKSYMIFHS